MTTIAVVALAAAVATATAPSSTASSSSTAARSFSVAAQPVTLAFGHSTVIGGTLADVGGATPGAPVAGEPLELRASRFPFGRYRDIGHATTGADGSFSFPSLHPDRNTRFEVVDLGMPSVVSAPVTVFVTAAAIQHVYRLRDGQAKITVLSYHGRDLDWGGRPVYWFAAPFGSRSFALLAVTHTREVHPGVTYMTATFYAPARHFAYRVCFDPPLERAYGPPPHPSCPTGSFVLPRPHRGSGH